MSNRKRRPHLIVSTMRRWYELVDASMDLMGADEERKGLKMAVDHFAERASEVERKLSRFRRASDAVRDVMDADDIHE